MGWRPDTDTWVKIKKAHCNENLKGVGGAECKSCPAEPFTCNIDFEAGADAMLQYQWSHPTACLSWEDFLKKSENGVWFWIPDDEVKK